MNFTFKQVRKIMGMQQGEVAKECGVCKKTVGRYELSQFFHKRVEAWYEDKELEILQKLYNATSQDEFTREQIRLIAGYSQEEVGAIVNMHPRTVARFEKGLSNHCVLKNWYDKTWEELKERYGKEEPEE